MLVVGVPLNVYVTARLHRLSREAPDAKVLHERALVAAIVLVVVIVFGLIFVNNDQSIPFLTGEVTKLITRAAVLALAIIPAIYWLRISR